MNMDTYLRRTYVQRSRSDKDQFPFWDYRSRRNAFSSSNSSFTSSGSSCDGSSISSTSTRSDPGSENTSLSDQSDTDSLMSCDQNKMALQFLTDSHEVTTMEELYLPLVHFIDPELNIVKITDKSDSYHGGTCMTSLPDFSSTLPSTAIMLFLQEEGALGFKRTQTVQRCFEKSPWKFHHSEQVNRGAINPYPYNSRDFYYTSEDLPLWAVRQVHAGKEFFRTLLFVSDKNWTKMLQFYKLVLGREPDVKREDFCLFTINAFQNFDIQLSLKKLQGDTKPRVLEGVKLQFKVSDLSNIVSLLPNICKPLSDTKWETTDVDGNLVVLETPPLISSQYSNSSLSERSSLSDRSSLFERNSSRNMGSEFAKRGRGESNQDSAKNRSSLDSSGRRERRKQRTRLFVTDDEKQRIKTETSNRDELMNINNVDIIQKGYSANPNKQIESIVTEVNTECIFNECIDNVKSFYV